MKKRIVSMILALSMVLSILPVSAFADAGAGLSSAAAEQTNSITYSSQNEHEDVGTNEETTNMVVKIKIGTDGLPKAASGTGWSYDKTTGLTITSENRDVEYILDGTVSCNVTVKNANSYNIVYLLDGTVTGKLYINADDNDCVRVQGGTYSDVVLNGGSIKGGNYRKLTQNDGVIYGGIFAGKLPDGVQLDSNASNLYLDLPDSCTVNGIFTGAVTVVDNMGESTYHTLTVHSDDPTVFGWVVNDWGVRVYLPQSEPYGGDSVKVTVQEKDTVEVRYHSALDRNFKLYPAGGSDKELQFTAKGVPDVTGTVKHITNSGYSQEKRNIYIGKDWVYSIDDVVGDAVGELFMSDLQGRTLDFGDPALIPADTEVNCYVNVKNGTIKNYRGGFLNDFNAQNCSIENGRFCEFAVENCTVSDSVIVACIPTSTTFSNCVFTYLSTDNIEEIEKNWLAKGQKMSKITVANGTVYTVDGFDCMGEGNYFNTAYVIGNVKADLLLSTDVVKVNGENVEDFTDESIKPEGTVLHLTGKNSGGDYQINEADTPVTAKQLEIAGNGKPDLTGVYGKKVSLSGMTAKIYSGDGWQYIELLEVPAGYIYPAGSSMLNLRADDDPRWNTVDLGAAPLNPSGAELHFMLQMSGGELTGGNFGENTMVMCSDTTVSGGSYYILNGNYRVNVKGGTFENGHLGYDSTASGGRFKNLFLEENAKVTGITAENVDVDGSKAEISNSVILNELTLESGTVEVRDTVCGKPMNKAYLADGQQQSKLTVSNGTVTAINGNAVATDTVYLIGNAKAELTFSNTVTDINGAAASDYNKGTSAIDRSLNITAKNDGEPIVVNMATTGKLPFSSLSKSDFTVSGTIDHQTVESSKEGVGKLSLVYVRTYDNAVFETYPATSGLPGVYKQRIVAQEGDKYTEGSLDIGEMVRKYLPNSTDFAYDPKTQTATYNGKMYFEDAPQYSIQYVAADGSFPSVTKPTKAGTYSVYIVVNDSDHYYGTQYEVDTYVVTEPTKPKHYYYWNGQEGKAHNEGDKITLSVDKQEGNNVIWKIEGLAEDAYTITDTGTHIELQFSMPSNDVRVTNHYEPIYYTLTVDGKEERRAFGKEVTFTAPEKEGHTFTGWEVDGVPEGTDASKATITFTMPANNVTLTPQYKKNTYTLTVDGKDEPRVFDEDVTVIAQPVEGKTFTGWKVTGLPTDVDTSKATITFKMPAKNVTLKAEYTENAPETYELKVTDATVTLKDGGAVADLTAVPVGTELVVTAPEKAGYTFDSWEKEGLPADANIDGATITFKMPANNVTLKAKYTENAPETYELKVTDATITLKDGGAVADLTAVPVGTELVATAAEKDGYTFTGWTATGLPANANIDGATVTFKMPANKVTLNAKYIANAPETYKLDVTDAKVTLKDGGAVADLTAVRVGTELVATAPEKDGYTFTGWEVTGLPADVDTTKATITFKMPANNVTLTPQYKKNTYTLTVDGVDEQHVAGDDINFIASDKEGYTFSYWKAEGVPEGTDTTKANIRFTMPANNVTLEAQYKQNTYTLTVNGKPEQRTFGEEVTLIARKPEGMTFSYWEIKKGLAADAVDVRSEKITFTMPANDVEISAIYNKVPTPDPDPETKTHKLNVLSAQIFLKDGSDVADLTAVPVGTELKAIAYEDTETNVFKCWTGLELTEEQRTARVVYFTMPDHDVNLVAEFVTPTKPEPKTYELKVTDAKVTLKDGGAVADLTAVPAGTELKATADEDTETSVFKNWSCTGLELTEEQRTAHEMYFTMPDHDVNLVAEFVTPTKPDPAPETYKLIVSYAKITLKDGSAVADLKAVPAGTELKATADEDTETSVFKNWNCTGLELTEEQRTARVVEFTMPDHDVELTAVFKVPATPDPDPTPAPGGDGGGAAIVAVAAVGGAAIGVGAYIAGTTAYLKSVLPEGMAIPANRQQLAVALWTAAGKPATQSTALFNDVAADAAELQAIRWVVDTGLMSAQDGSFRPGSRVGRMEVIRTWKTYQQRG